MNKQIRELRKMDEKSLEMPYQEKIEKVWDMTKNEAIKAALEDGALLAAKESEWSGMEPEDIIAEIAGEMFCGHCGLRHLSDDPEIAEEMLCDRCANEINHPGIIGYRKGE